MPGLIFFDPYQLERRSINQGVAGMQSILTNLALLAVQQKFRAKEAEIAATRQEGLLGKKLEASGVVQEAEAQKHTIKLGGKEYVPTQPQTVTAAGVEAVLHQGTLTFPPAPKQPPSIIQEWEQYKGAVPDATIEGFYKARRQPGTTVNIDTKGLQKKTIADHEAKYFAGKEQIARMQAIKAEFRPEYLELGTRGGHAWTTVKARMAWKVTPEERAGLKGYTKFRRKAQENINLYIKEMTGAQMSELEARRLKLAQPDPGDKWYTGADPISFEAKMNDVIEFTEAANQRYEYYRAQGMSHKQIQGMINDNRAVSLDKIVAERRKMRGI
jgi:hypothetical protein